MRDSSAVGNLEGEENAKKELVNLKDGLEKLRKANEDGLFQYHSRNQAVISRWPFNKQFQRSGNSGWAQAYLRHYTETPQMAWLT